MPHTQGHNGPHHGHGHPPSAAGGNERKILFSFLLIFTFMIVEVAGGIISGSLALLADAGHMLTDAAALALAYAAFRFGRLAADRRRTFGYSRLEVVAGFVNAITLFLIVAWIVYEAWQRFREPQAILAGPMLVVALMGLVVNLVVFWILMQGDRDHVNVKGALLHVLGDLLGSIGAVFAAVVIYMTGWTPIDPILSVFVSVLILGSAWRLLGNSLHILLEGAPDGASPEEIRQYLEAEVKGISSIRHVHVWLITSGRALATLHVRPQKDGEARQVTHAIEQALRERFGIDHSTVAIDWNEDEQGEACSLEHADQ